jgi:hypothetical protein
MMIELKGHRNSKKIISQTQEEERPEIRTTEE